MADGGGAPRWVRWWFRGGAIFGAVALIGSLLGPPPPPVAQLPQLAFTGTALAFQIVFWIIGGDPVRHRALMPAGVVEKLAFGVPALMLAGGPGVPAAILPFALIDLLLGAGFLLAWRATPASRSGA